MRIRLLIPLVAGCTGLSLLVAPGVGAAPAAAPAADPGFVLTTTQPGGPGFAPAFVGNGYLAGRQPAEGQGFAQVHLPDRQLPTQSQVHGFFAKEVPFTPPGLPPSPPIERRAALPAWSTLSYDDGSGRYSLNTGEVTAYRQSLDVSTGTLSTEVSWTSPRGRSVDLTYDVTPDRVHRHAAMVRLRLVPHFNGPVTVTDLLDGQAAELVTSQGTGHSGNTQWVKLSSVVMGMTATVASTVVAPAGAEVEPAPSSDDLTVGQNVTFRARSGQSYTITKAVGVAVNADSADPFAVAVAASQAEAALGYDAMRTGSDAAWAELWRSDIVVSGDARLQRQVRAAFFSLLASVRDDTPWAPSPGGLSSDGYNGHVFWDSETWMYPSLLVTEPAIAEQSLQYRVDRLQAAYRYAADTGWSGARYPWESAFSGGEDTPTWANTGLWEIHVSGDIALAVWQYWLATGDRAWLASEGWPVLKGIADFWVSRATKNPGGTYGINTVIPPDEYVEEVDDSVYTNVAARDSLRHATMAAALVGQRASPQWSQVADRLRVLFDSSRGIHPEYAGYPGDAVKQADVTLLSYPWENDQSAAVTRADLEFYVPRTDPGGPSMTDAIHSVVSSQLGIEGCPAFTFTRRSIDPFMRPPYDQFSEARTGGAFTFTTGSGGFLQEFLYGYTGFRWRGDRIRLDPSLPPQLTGVTASALHWRGRVLRVSVGPQQTQVTLLSGAAVTVETPAGTRTVAPGAPLVLPTRRPDLTPTANIARCKPTLAAPATAEPAEAAADGTDITQWIGPTSSASIRVDLGTAVPLGQVSVTRSPVTTFASTTGGKGVTKPTVSAGERVEASADGTTWRTVGTVSSPTLSDTVPGDGRPARYVRLVALGATEEVPLIVGELGVRAG
ncbi:MAG TPA: glycosyl hydrolase family 65 protein [Actinoplanes sp.]|nr:glycosyl hydrolase family 65 protein [Actinoplanes sp.]